MPGIHVRTSDKFDWIYREKEPLLTVPGSYWLCHKKSIYKFTFKYHRNSKDNKQFNYGKELMKVIRRIIKSQPRQGQQFGTRHLLVTYNHSSWTRQDKMFAMLKFREKTNATAFSRAFVLTVKLLSANLINQNETELDDLVEYDTNRKPNEWSEIIQKKESDESIEISQNIQSASANIEEMCDNSMKSQLIYFDGIQNNIKSPFSNSTKNNEDTKKVSVSFSSNLKDLPFIEGHTPQQQDISNIEHTINNKAESFNEIQESIDMPYQYLIEREIERTNSKGTDNSNIQPVVLKNVLEKPTRDLCNEPVVFRARTFSTSNIIDNATARSANITDLVMEGLMFTISQNQDSITVLEQKTKSEPDEVLENSEKAETVKGSKHLINSSLFKLENLITKIEMSNNSQVTSEREKNNKTTFLSNIFHKNDLIDQENSKNSYIEVNGNKDNIDNIDNNMLANENEKIIKSVRPFRLSMDSLQMKKPAIPSLKNLTSSTHNVENRTLKQFDDKNSFDSESIAKKNILLKHLSKKIFIEKMNIDERDKNLKLNNNIYDNNVNIINDVEEWNANDEEEIIPEALQNHQSICCKIDQNNASSTQDDESNLLMDDIESEKQSHSPNNKLINKLHVPRVISNEVVQYDLSSLRTSKLEESNSNTCNPTVNTNIKCKYRSEAYLHRNKYESCDEIINTNRKKLTARRRLYTQKSNTDNEEISIEMWKFLQDITHGVKIVLQRLS